MKADELIQAIEYMKIKHGNDIEIKHEDDGTLSVILNEKCIDYIEMIFFIEDDYKIKE